MALEKIDFINNIKSEKTDISIVYTLSHPHILDFKLIIY